jgi:lysophospholipase L1-like esterase
MEGAIRATGRAILYLIVTGTATLGLMEGALQVASLWVRSSRVETAGTWQSRNFRVLCAGDSNTYGVYLDSREEAWPARLETVWNESPGSPQIEVLNLGYPGTSSSLLLSHMPRLMETFDPDLVLAMIGVNDYWTIPTPVATEPEPFSLARFLARHSRLHRLVTMAIHARNPDEIEADVARAFPKGGTGTIRYGGEQFAMEYAWGPRDRKEASRELARGLLALREAAGERPLVLLTYPSRVGAYARVNRIIRRSAETHGLPLIDTAAAFQELCPDTTCEALFVPDQHPNAAGYRKAAEVIAEGLSAMPPLGSPRSSPGLPKADPGPS